MLFLEEISKLLKKKYSERILEEFKKTPKKLKIVDKIKWKIDKIKIEEIKNQQIIFSVRIKEISKGRLFFISILRMKIDEYYKVPICEILNEIQPFKIDRNFDENYGL